MLQHEVFWRSAFQHIREYVKFASRQCRKYSRNLKLLISWNQLERFGEIRTNQRHEGTSHFNEPMCVHKESANDTQWHIYPTRTDAPLKVHFRNGWMGFVDICNNSGAQNT